MTATPPASSPLPGLQLPPAPLTVLELGRRIEAAVNTAPTLRGLWVVAETIDVRPGTHCYLSLVQKADDGSGSTVAKIGAACWASSWRLVGRKFAEATGSPLRDGLRVMVRGDVTYHANYGVKFVISDIDPSYTLGDLERRRREILATLQREGVLELNQKLKWPCPLTRVAIVSSRSAAGYGDFIHQLLTSPRHYRFRPRLFDTPVQGTAAAAAIIQALRHISANAADWDVVVIIRGGGSSIDLEAYDNLELARAVATCPVPVIIGIGHERDVTVLDWVAKHKVKTPTAAAALLIHLTDMLLERTEQRGAAVLAAAQAALSSERQRLAACAARMALAPRMAVERASARLDLAAQGVRDAATTLLAKEAERLQARSRLLGALSLDATLSRGFSVTRLSDGRALTHPGQAAPGALLVTLLAGGTVKSEVLK